MGLISDKARVRTALLALGTVLLAVSVALPWYHLSRHFLVLFGSAGEAQHSADVLNGTLTAWRTVPSLAIVISATTLYGALLATASARARKLSRRRALVAAAPLLACAIWVAIRVAHPPQAVAGVPLAGVTHLVPSAGVGLAGAGLVALAVGVAFGARRSHGSAKTPAVAVPPVS